MTGDNAREFTKSVVASLVAALLFGGLSWLVIDVLNIRQISTLIRDMFLSNINVPVWLAAMCIVIFTVFAVVRVYFRSSPTVRHVVPVITDPRFIESSIFHWVFSQQPLASAGIRFQLIACDWRSIPEKLSATPNSIGMFNRRTVVTFERRPIYDVALWSDLTLYKGYALIIRSDGSITSPVSLPQATQHLKETLKSRQDSDSKPVIICMGADTVWKIVTPFTPDFDLDDYHIESFDSPDVALKTFLVFNCIN